MTPGTSPRSAERLTEGEEGATGPDGQSTEIVRRLDALLEAFRELQIVLPVDSLAEVWGRYNRRVGFMER